ncbi:MAG TPA: hypothetical protein EYH18_00825 [Aquifex sp.]|nr:hypothetical protein [Aquifex sp.]
MERFKKYKFFAHLFAYPERKEDFFKALKEFYPFEDLKPLEELQKVAFEEIQAEYTSLFVANFPKVPCKPYQSFFESQTLMGEPTFRCEKFYRLFNLETGKELPDAVYVELDFCAFLIKLKEESPYGEDKGKLEVIFREFFKTCVAWMERFAQCVKKNTGLKPLRELTTLFERFIREEREKLGV